MDRAINQQLIDLTRTLIDIPSVSLHEQELMTFIKQRLPADLFLAHDNSDVLFVTTPRRPNMPLVIIAGHTDTVPIEDNVPSKQEDDIIYGRGASDMKGALAVMLMLADVCAAEPPISFDLGFLFFTCEELSTSYNVLLPSIKEIQEIRNASFAILMEPTSNALEVGCQGNLNFSLTFKGQAAHSARPWMGRNAAHDMIRTLQDFVDIEPNDVFIDSMQFREVANVTGIRGGVARNVITPEVIVDINVRYAPSRSAKEVEQKWRERFALDNIEMEITGNSPPAPVVLHHPIVDQLQAAGSTGVTAKLGWTNAADFAVNNIPAINFGPGDPQYAHRADEQITGNALTTSLEILQRFVSQPMNWAITQ